MAGGRIIGGLVDVGTGEGGFSGVEEVFVRHVYGVDKVWRSDCYWGFGPICQSYYRVRAHPT